MYIYNEWKYAHIFWYVWYSYMLKHHMLVSIRTLPFCLLICIDSTNAQSHEYSPWNVPLWDGNQNWNECNLFEYSFSKHKKETFRNLIHLIANPNSMLSISHNFIFKSNINPQSLNQWNKSWEQRMSRCYFFFFFLLPTIPRNKSNFVLCVTQ